MQNDIYYIAREIFNNEPQPPHSIQLDIINQTNCAVLFEILSILFVECLDLKIPAYVRNQHSIERLIEVLKEYYQSFSMDFDFEIVENDDRDCHRILTFQTDRLYNLFGIRTEFKYYDFYIPYEVGLHTSNTLDDFKLCIRFNGVTYRISFKLFR